MIKEAIEKILSLAEPNSVLFNGKTYYDKPLTLLTTPVDETVNVSTLQGLVDLYNSDLDGIKEQSVLVHITGTQSVHLVESGCDDFGRRHVWVKAQFPSDVQKFPFGQWLSTENFIIGVQSCFQRAFVETPEGGIIGDLEYVQKVASHISAESKVTYADDGISQSVDMNKGVVLKEQATLRSRVQLAPYRTFSEINQPLSTFVFRVREQNGAIQLALFEADGGRWKLDATKSIGEWLAKRLQNVPVIS